MFNKKDIANNIKHVPEKPGVYQYYDNHKKTLYVGKAKNLKKRISSYFTKRKQNKKTKKLVEKISSINYILVKSEMDALLLENNLIKKHKPKYNVLLKDDKTYPWICVKNEPFPRVFQTRILLDDGSFYFGPYTSVRMVKTILNFLHELYPLRSCSLNLIDKNIQSKKFNVCLEYHLKNCLGPCVGNQKNQNYLVGINHIKKILSGNIKDVVRSLEKIMNSFSKKLEYEQAQKIKEKIALLKKYQSKSTVVNKKINDVDVFSINSDEKYAFINFLKIKSGSIVQAHTLELSKKLNETEEALLKLGIFEIRKRFNSSSKEIYSSISLKSFSEDFVITTPKIGDKKRLVELSLKNGKHLLLEKNRKQKLNYEKKKKTRVLEALKNDFQLKNTPNHIECFDISNIQGSNSVGSCVVFKNGNAEKKDYRFFNIKSVSGPNDFASIEEVVYRRYKRVLKEKLKIPQLIIVDGGKGQLKSAKNSLEKLKLINVVDIVGIAKRLEEIYLLNDPFPVFLEKRSESLRLIQTIRNEAHRFAIKNHRKKREKEKLQTSLDEINGIGEKTIQLLMTKFGSVKKIMEAEKKELIRLIGKSKTDKLFK